MDLQNLSQVNVFVEIGAKWIRKVKNSSVIYVICSLDLELLSIQKGHLTSPLKGPQTSPYFILVIYALASGEGSEIC